MAPTRLLVPRIVLSTVALLAGSCAQYTSAGSGLISVIASPRTATVAPGKRVSFSAAVNGVASGESAGVIWSVQEPGGGTVDLAGVYTAPATTGTFHVVATSFADPSSSDTATVTVSGTTPIAVSVTPSSASTLSGGTVQFAAAVTGTATGQSTAVTWSVQEAGGGSVDAAGLYTAPAAIGTYHVVAASVADPAQTDIATVQVTATPVIAVSVAPKTAATTTGGALTFSATVTGMAVGQSNAVTWSVQEAGGGTVDAAGHYTAPASPGTFHVVAKSVADTAKQGTATVTVTSISVAVSPAIATTGTGASTAFTAAVTGTVTGQSTAVTWSVQEAGGGTVNALGMYTAPAAAGTYHVVATSVADPTRSGSAQVNVVSGGGGGGSYLFQPDRITTWKPGITYNGGIPTNRTQCGSTLQPSGGNDFTQIQNAIVGCPSGQYVLLGTGTFNITGTSPLIIGKSDITLRGSGAGITILHRTDGATDGSYFTNANAPVLIVGPNGRWPNGPGAASYTLTADGTHGAVSVTLSGASSATFTAGQIVLLDEMANESYVPDAAGPNPDGHGTNILQSDDGLLTWAAWSPEVNPGGISEDPRTNAYSRDHRITSEIKEVASWNAGTGMLTFTSPIHARYRVDHVAQVATFAAADAPLRNVGVEAMTIDRGDNGNLYFQNCAYCWAKNVELTKWLGEGIRFSSSFRCELRDSYVHTPVFFEPGGGSYNIAIDNGTSEVLVENNISRDADKVIVARGAGAGSVVAYNYMDDGHIGSNPGWQEMGVGGSHFIGPHHILFEGNWGYNGDNDKTHGNSWGHTYFRNHLTGKRTNYDSKCTGRAAGITRSTKKMSFVGNVLGLPGQTGGLVYESTSQSTDAIWRLGWDDWNPYLYDAVAVADTVRDGNFDYLTNAVHWHGLGGADGSGTPATLPASLYLTSKPAFFGSNVWPWVDPLGATKTYTLPAKARYDAGTPNTVP